MSIELDKGDVFITVGDTTMELGRGIPFTEKIELSAAENPPHLYHFNDIPSVSFEISVDDLSLMNNFCNMPPSNGKFTIETYRNIMIQARWHKKPRIRKKWLKRFGMKLDTVKMRMDATVLEYHPGHILDEQYDDRGICATFNSFDFETDVPEYLWRPDQLRKDLKIEF